MLRRIAEVEFDANMSAPCASWGLLFLLILPQIAAFAGLHAKPNPLRLSPHRSLCSYKPPRSGGEAARLRMVADGGDLYEGLFDERNQQVRFLRKQLIFIGAS